MQLGDQFLCPLCKTECIPDPDDPMYMGMCPKDGRVYSRWLAGRHWVYEYSVAPYDPVAGKPGTPK